MKKLIALVMSVLILTGCSGIANKDNIMSLLSSPKLSERESEIVDSIKEYLGQDIILKYPKQGNNISPVQMVDLTGDGKEEAVVLYVAPSNGNNVRIAVLSDEDKNWQVIYDNEGFGKSVYSIQFDSINKTKPNQILVGYTFADTSEKFLTIYSFNDDNSVDFHTLPCQDYVVHDVTQDGMGDLVLASLNGEKKNTNIQVFSSTEDGTFSVMAEKKLNVPNAQVTGIAFSKNDFSENEAIIVDYYDSYHRVSTQGMYYDEGELVTILDPEAVQKIWAYDYSLNSMDVDGDGYYETPSIIDDETSRSPDIKLMEWTNFLMETPERKYFGICNALAGTFFPLPDEWQNYISIDGNEKSWSVSKSSDGKELVKFEVVSYGEEFLLEENQQLVNSGTLQIKLTFDESVSNSQQKYICDGFIYLK